MVDSHHYDEYTYYDNDTEAMMLKKKPMNIEEVITVFGLTMLTAKVDMLAGHGFEAIENLKGTSIDFKVGGNEVVTHLPLKAGAVKLIKEGLMPKAGKDAVMSKVISAVEICLQKALKDHENENEPDGIGSVWEDLAGGVHVEAKTATEANADKLKAHIKEAVADVPPVEVHVDMGAVENNVDEFLNGISPKKPHDALQMKKVALGNAKHMYQPVNSTSESSTYHLVAMTKDLKFAARTIHGDLSVRVEGAVKEHKKALIGAGFNEGYITKGYTSVHFSGINGVLAKRTLGAVLMGTGLTFETKVPDLGVIEGHGS